MATYVLTMEKIKTKEELQKRSNLFNLKKEQKTDLVKKWELWISENEYYKTHKFRKDGVMAAIYTVKIEGLDKSFPSEQWLLDTREWFKQYIYEINECGYIFAESHSFNKSGTNFFENIIVLSPTDSGKLEYHTLTKINSLRRLQKTFAQYMSTRYQIASIGRISPSLLKSQDKTNRGILYDKQDLPVKNENESDEDYYKRINDIFHANIDRYKENSFKKHKQLEAAIAKNNESKLSSSELDAINQYASKMLSVQKEISGLLAESKSISEQKDTLLKIQEQLNEFVTVTNSYGGMDSIKLGMRFASVIKYARRYYKEINDTTMQKSLDKMVIDGERYAKEHGVTL